MVALINFSKNVLIMILELLRLLVIFYSSILKSFYTVIYKIAIFFFFFTLFDFYNCISNCICSFPCKSSILYIIYLYLYYTFLPSSYSQSFLPFHYLPPSLTASPYLPPLRHLSYHFPSSTPSPRPLTPHPTPFTHLCSHVG